MEELEMARILIVDDALFVRQSMKAALLAVGHDVVGEAVNGLEGLRQTARLEPDLVILDINMPQMDGITALKVMRQNHPHVRVLLCSALAEGPQAAEAKTLGVQGLLRKPYQPEDFIAAVIMALSVPMTQTAA
jgi:two-component system chemotaxis response regulator CheY